MKFPPSSFFLYGETRTGKSHLLLTMRPEGRMLIADVEGQIAAEATDAHRCVIPEPLPEGASEADKAERLERRNAVLAEASKADLVTWPCFTTRDYHACLAALQSGRLGQFSSFGLDSFTFLCERLISEICGVSIVHRKRDGTEDDAQDPVLADLPDFTGQNVHRSMEVKDWQRFLQKATELATGAKFVTQRLNAHLIVTALEEKRDIYEGEGRNKRFLRTAQGPLIGGRQAATVIPPGFMYLLRTVCKVEDDGAMRFAVQTRRANGWPCGVRGERAATILKVYEPNPNLYEILSRIHSK